MAEVARELGIRENMLRRWKQQLAEEGTGVFPGKGHLRPEDEEIRRLRRQLADVTEERDILKKVMAVFSRRGLYGMRLFGSVGINFGSGACVGSSGYYAWTRHPESRRARENRE